MHGKEDIWSEEEDIEAPLCTQKTGGRSLRTHDLFFASEDEGRDFQSVLQEIQAYLSKEYSNPLSLLQAAKIYWESLPEGYEGKRFYHISTDEVYGALQMTHPEGTASSLRLASFCSTMRSTLPSRSRMMRP